jgi:hypothetical protein
MRRRASVLVLALVGLLGLGCSGSIASLSPGEQRVACEAWVKQVNGLEGCLHVRYEADNLCEGVEHQPIEIVGWFRCLEEHARCDGDTPVFEPEACPVPVRKAEVQG